MLRDEELIILKTTEWKPLGIRCPCGCREELLTVKWPCTERAARTVKCQRTNRVGLLYYRDSFRGVIDRVEWT